MRHLSRLALVGVLAGCVSIRVAPTSVPTATPPAETQQPPIVQPSESPTEPPTPAPSAPPALTAEPAAVQPTAEPTPPGTPDPNATPTLDPRELLGAEVTIFNLSDDTMTVSAYIVEATEEGDLLLSEFELPPEQATVRSVIAIEDVLLPYRIEFSYPSGASAVGGACTVAVMAGDEITFVAVPEGLTISKLGVEPASAEDMIIATAPLCTAEAEGPLI